MLLQPQLIQAISSFAGKALQPGHFDPVGGGSINEVYRLQSGQGQPLIIKLNSAAEFPQLFALEANGLEQLQPYIRVPQVMGVGEQAGTQFLLLEWIEGGARNQNFWKTFGAALARLHTVKGAAFGAAKNNYMGAVPQDNTQSESWSNFFAQRRLLPLAHQCLKKALLGKTELEQLERLCAMLPQLFSDSAPVLLHGDLWSGNFLCSKESSPVLIDPAVYFGHPSVDLGMTTLFGGFDSIFYEAYHYHAPLPPNYKDEWELCNLYPLLIHLLLFGSGYLSGIKRTLQRFAGTQQ